MIIRKIGKSRSKRFCCNFKSFLDFLTRKCIIFCAHDFALLKVNAGADFLCATFSFTKNISQSAHLLMKTSVVLYLLPVIV